MNKDRQLIPAPVEVTAALTATAEGSRHKLNSYQGYYVDVVASLDLRKTTAGNANITVELRENIFETVLHSRTITLVQNVWTPIELKGIINRIDDAAELQIVLSASIANLNYKIVAQRHLQQGG